MIIFWLVRDERFELSTNGLKIRYSTAWVMRQRISTRWFLQSVMFMKTAVSSKRSIMVPSVGLEPTCSKRSVAVWVPNVYQFHHDGMVLKYCATSASVVFLLTYYNKVQRTCQAKISDGFGFAFASQRHQPTVASHPHCKNNYTLFLKICQALFAWFLWGKFSKTLCSS